MIELFRNIIASFVTIVVYTIFYPLRFFIKINVDPDIYNLKKPVVFVSNHVSVFDPFLIANSLPLRVLIKNLPVRIFAGTKFKGNGFLEFLELFNIINIIYYIYNCVRVPSEGTSEEKIYELTKVIKSGYSVLIFPEGSKISKDGNLGEIKKGIKILRKQNTEVNFIFVKLKFEKKLIFLSVNFSKPSTEMVEEYEKYVYNALNE
jgi:1-acyl-sn-glycerol-3-phosphate acyltransferase